MSTVGSAPMSMLSRANTALTHSVTAGRDYPAYLNRWRTLCAGGVEVVSLPGNHRQAVSANRAGDVVAVLDTLLAGAY